MTLLLLIAAYMSAANSTMLMIPDKFVATNRTRDRYDWTKLLDVFPVTTQTWEFRDYARYADRVNFSGGFPPVGNRKRKSWFAIEVDDRGSIITIALYNMRLTDLCIGDLSKLPASLRTLNLHGNELTEFDPNSLPRGLQCLYLGCNKLREFAVDCLPWGIKRLSLVGNRLTSIDLRFLPPGIKYVYLGKNYLSSDDFKGIPRGFCRNVKVLGAGTQRVQKSSNAQTS